MRGLFNIPRVLIFVTIDAQQFPIATVRWIVIVVVVFVVYREFTKFFTLKLSSAARAYRGIHLECLSPISLLPDILVVSGLGDELVYIWLCLLL